MEERKILPILSEVKLAQLVKDAKGAVGVEKRGFIPVIVPKEEFITRYREEAAKVEVVYVTHDSQERNIEIPPYAAAINPALKGNGADSVVVWNANAQPKFDNLYTGEILTFSDAIDKAKETGSVVQGDPEILKNVSGNGRVILRITKKDGAITDIIGTEEDFQLGWRQTSAEAPRTVVLSPTDFVGAVFKPNWKSIQPVSGSTLLVANGNEGYFDQAGLDARLSLLVRKEDGAPVPSLANDQIGSLTQEQVATAAFTAEELANLPEEEKDKLVTAIAKLSHERQVGIHNWLKSIELPDFMSEPVAPETSPIEPPAGKKKGNIWGTLVVGALIVAAGAASFGGIFAKRFTSNSPNTAPVESPVLPPVVPQAPAPDSFRVNSYERAPNGVMTLTGQYRGAEMIVTIGDGPNKADTFPADEGGKQRLIGESVANDINLQVKDGGPVRITGQSFPIGDRPRELDQR